MSIKRLGRYLLGLFISVIVLPLVLPHVGVPQTRFLPPPIVYQQATGLVPGDILKAYNVPTNDPFNVGGELYFVDYRFFAPPVDSPPGAKSTQEYTGTVRIASKESYEKFTTPVFGTPAYSMNGGNPVIQNITVRYEKTYPWVNGLDDPPIGIGCGEGSNILSGWLIWVASVFVLAFIIMVIIDQFASKEDI
jgi:hypothetical protein